MIHEGMLLDYAGWQLAMLHAASYIKQITFFALAASMMPGGLVGIGLGMMLLAIGITLVETLYAKLRLFRVPELFATGTLLACASFLLRFIGGPSN